MFSSHEWKLFPCKTHQKWILILGFPYLPENFSKRKGDSSYFQFFTAFSQNHRYMITNYMSIILPRAYVFLQIPPFIMIISTLSQGQRYLKLSKLKLNISFRSKCLRDEDLDVFTAYAPLLSNMSFFYACTSTNQIEKCAYSSGEGTI